MLYLAPRIGFAALLLSVVLPSIAAASADQPAENEENYIKEYLAGASVEGYRQQLEAESVTSIRPGKTTAPASLGQAYETFLPDLIRALEADYGSIWLLKNEYEQLKAEHLLFSAYLGDVDEKLGAYERNQSKFSERYLTLVNPLFEGLDSFYENYGSIGNASFTDDVSSIFSNYFDVRNLQDVAAQLNQLVTAPYHPIIRTSGLPYDTLNLATVEPATQHVISPSYQKTPAPNPTATDLEATLQTPLSDEILELAAQLNYDPAAAFQYVRNKIRREWYAGAMKGAIETLEQGAGNDVDQASLLIALLRASSVPARYVHGVVELNIDQLQSELGIQDPTDVVKAIRSSGVPVKSVVRGGRIDAVQVAHTWVSAYVPYTNYRGATVDRSGKIWLPLDASQKNYTRQASTGVLGEMSDSVPGWINEYFQEVQARTPLEKVRGYVEQHMSATSGESYESQLGSLSIDQDELDYLPNSLKTAVVAVTGEESKLSGGHLQTLRFKLHSTNDVASEVILDTTLPLSTLASRRVTLSYLPATSDDHNIINSFGGLDGVPPYLVKLRAQIKVDGKVVAVSKTGVSMARWQRFEVDVESPTHTETLSKEVLSGGYEAIGVSAQKVTNTTDTTTEGDTEYLAARLLSQAALRYLKAWDESEDELAQLAGLSLIRPLPSVVFVGQNLTVARVMNEPQLINWKGITMDAALRVAEVVPQGETALASDQFYQLSGLQGSYLEHDRFEQDFTVDSISADKGLALARNQGLEILTLTDADTQSVASLPFSDEVRADVKQWLAQGYEVRIPSGRITYADWSGAAWIVTNPQTGAQGYFLSGGIAGGQTASVEWPSSLRNSLVNEYSEPPETNVTLVAVLEKIASTDLQDGIVGEAGEPLAIRAMTEEGRPVAGAEITFTRELGGIEFEGQKEITVTTNNQGIAQAPFQHGTNTSISSIYRKVDPSQTYADRVSYSSVIAQASSGAKLHAPFEMFTFPGEVTKLDIKTNGRSTSPGAWADTTLIRALDKYDNPVSNATITVTVGSPSPLLHQGSLNAQVASDIGACPRIPSLWNCGASSMIEKTGPLYGVSAFLFNGNESGVTYRWTASTGTVSETITNTVSSQSESLVHVEFQTQMAADGTVGSATRIGEEYPDPLYFKMYRQDKTAQFDESGTVYKQYQMVPVEFVGNPTLKVTQGSVVSGEAYGLLSIGNGRYSMRVRVGDTPGRNVIQVSGDVTDQQSVVNSMAGLAYGVLPEITAHEPEAGLVLDGAMTTLQPLLLKHTAQPETYSDPNRRVYIYEDGDLILNTLAESLHVASLPSGLQVDIDKTYTAKLVFNRGSKYEIASDPYPLPVFQRTIAYPQQNKVVTVSREVDLMNEWTCNSNADFPFALNHPATVSLTLTNHYTGKETDLLDAVNFAKGVQSVELPTETLSEGIYEYRMSTISSLDNHTEEVTGYVWVEYNLESNLPVGHAIEENVDLFDGHLFLTRDDFSVKSRGPDLAFTRYYSSNSRNSGTLGAGWGHNLDSQVRESGCGSVSITGGAGGGRYFPDGNGGYRPQKGLHGHLEKLADGSGWVFTAKDGTKYHYEKFGFNNRSWQLGYIEGTNGNVLALGYDPAATEPLLKVARDEAGRALEFEYEPKKGQLNSLDTQVISRINAPYGIEYLFEYDDQGRLSKVTKKGKDGTEISESYGYDSPSLLGAEIQRFNNLNTLTTPNGDQIDYAYGIQSILSRRADPNAPTVRVSSVESVTRHQTDAPDEVIDFTYSSRENRDGELTASVDRGNGHRRDYTLNQYGSPTEVVSPAGTVTTQWTPDDVLMTSRTDERGVTITYEHDEWGNVTSEKTGDLPGIARTYATIGGTRIRNRLASEMGRNGETTEYEYDERGNVTEIRYPEAYVESFTYAENGDRLTHTDRNGSTTSYQSYDSYGYPTAIANPVYCCDKTTWNELGLKTSTTNGRGAVTEFTYDDLGRRTAIKDAEGDVRSYTYDAQDNKLSEVDQEGRTTRWEYNERDQVTRIEKTLGDGTISRDKEYDQYGNLKRESDWLPEGKTHWTRYVYDAANRQTDIYRENGSGNERHTHKVYDGVGNVVREERDLGRFQRYEYDDLSRLVRVYDAFDELTREVVYDDLGKTRTEYDKLRRKVITHFDGLGRAVRTEQTLVSGKTKAIERTYDGNGNVVAETNPIGRLTKTQYDALDRKIEQAVYGSATDVLTRQYWSYDEAGNVTRQINGRGVASVFEYDLLNRKTREEFPKGSGEVHTYAYDKVGNRIEDTWPNGNVVAMVYDDLNRLDTRSDTLGLIEDNDYDANGNVTRKVDANGNVTTFEYNGLNEWLVRHLPEDRKDVRTYDLVGNLTSESRQTESGDRVSTTTYTYDLLNRKETETDQLGFTTTYGYDEVGNLVSVKDKRDHETTYAYNDLNQRITTTDPNGDVLTVGYDLVGNVVREEDKKGHVTNRAYDRLNRLTRVERNDIRIKTNEYDEVGNLVNETDANGNVTARVYDDANRLVELSREESSLTRYAYDLLGNRTAECDPESRPTNWRYDARGRQVFEINAKGETTTYQYDGNGNRIAQTKPKGNDTESVSCGYNDTVLATYPGDSSEYTWHYGYDGADRLVSVTDGDGEDTTYTYNFMDQRTGQTDALDHATAMAYDDLGRLGTVTYPDGKQEQYTEYDGNGNLTAMTDAKGNQVAYVYDTLDRETRRHFTPAEPLASEVVQVDTAYDKNGNVVSITETDNVGDTRVTTQGYDSFDRLIRREDSFGKVTSYAYDNNGNRTRLVDPDQNVTRYTFDKLNRVATVSNLQGTTGYTYDKSGLRVKVTYPSGSAMAYSYDPVGRTEAITHTQNNAQVSAYRYAYDAHGNRFRQEEENGRGLEVSTYRYDNLDRLTEVTYPDVPAGTGTSVLYTYDAAYNRTGETTLNVEATTIVDKTYHYNARNQLTGLDDNLDPAQAITYTFDANGNQTAKTTATVSTDFVYDVRDNLRSVTTGGSTVGQFLYDYRGMRIEKDGARGIERYSYDDQSVLTQFDESGATLAKFEYGGQRLISLNSLDNGLQYYHFDALGSPVTLTKPDGTVQARYSYDAWGHRRYQNGESWNRFGFTGHEEDRETGLIYAKARYYDPDTGRFLSQDPWDGDTTIAPSLNKYLYAYMNPLGYVDPDGRMGCSIAVDIAMCNQYTAEVIGVDPNTLEGVKAVSDYDRGQVVGGFKAVGSAIKDTAMLAWDLGGSALYGLSGGRIASDESNRLGQRVDGAISFIKDPVGAIKSGFETLNQSMQGALERNDYQLAGEITGEFGTNVGMALAPAASSLKLGRLGRSGITVEAPSGGTHLYPDLSVGAKQTPPEILARGDDPYGSLPSTPSSLLDDIVDEANQVASRGGEITDVQRLALRQNLPVVQRRSPAQNKVLRTEFEKNKEALMNSWSGATGRDWPMIETANGTFKTATPHHIIPLESGGSNKWWNLMPTFGALPNHSLPGIDGPHARGGVLRETIQRGPKALPPGIQTDLRGTRE